MIKKTKIKMRKRQRKMRKIKKSGEKRKISTKWRKQGRNKLTVGPRPSGHQKQLPGL